MSTSTLPPFADFEEFRGIFVNGYSHTDIAKLRWIANGLLGTPDIRLLLRRLGYRTEAELFAKEHVTLLELFYNKKADFFASFDQVRERVTRGHVGHYMATP